MVTIQAVEVSKRFGEVRALDRVSLEVGHGELFTLLGPSGCGKTTFLRAVAGFELVDSGRIIFDHEEVTTLPAHKRNTGMVFQNYALWPHMTVFDNIAYGLRVQKVPGDDIARRVIEVLRMVRLEGLEHRTPHQLSGGQQQRVALARALVIRPKVLLFDEPLSNLDAKLRLEMRAEIKRIQRELGTTAVYVTHDQEEAMSISDRIAIMHQGQIKQTGVPTDIYFRPSNQFVADFIGQGTFLEGRVVAVSQHLRVALDRGGEVLASPSDLTKVPSEGDRVLIAIRPESFELGDHFRNRFSCHVYHISFLGKSKRLQAKSDGDMFLVEVHPVTSVEVGQDITVSVEPSKTLAIQL